MAINYEYYRAFYYAGKYKNLTQAAKFLYTSQPNVSRSIAMLEREYGCRLIERSNRGVNLTPEGETLFDYVQPAIERLKLAEASIAQLSNLQQGSVSIGVSDTALSEIVVPALNQFRELYPLIRVRITASRSLDSVKEVKNSVCDFAIVATPFPEDESLVCTPIMDVSDIMICGSNYEFLAHNAYSLTELSRYPLVCIGKDSVYYPFLTALYAEDGLCFQPDIISTTTAETILMVKNGLGIGFVPEVMADEELDRKSIFQVSLKKEMPKRSICLVERKGRSLSAAARELKKVILSFKPQF